MLSLSNGTVLTLPPYQPTSTYSPAPAGRKRSRLSCLDNQGNRRNTYTRSRSVCSTCIAWCLLLQRQEQQVTLRCGSPPIVNGSTLAFTSRSCEPRRATAYESNGGDTFLFWIRDVVFTQHLGVLGCKTHLTSRVLACWRHFEKPQPHDFLSCVVYWPRAGGSGSGSGHR